MTIAILSPSATAYSETFIQAHKNLRGNVFFFYDGEIPKKVEGQEGTSILFKLLLRVISVFYRIFTLEKNYYDKFILKRNLSKCKIDVGLAEYGPTGANCYQIFRELNIPLVVHFHGYDVSVRNIIEKYREAYLKMFNYSSAIIAVSKEMKCRLIELGASKDKIFLNLY